tara:strand:- start:6963 stop:7280 length:318 start_codon:yes stop_codon:yes gene_type:complete
MSYECPYCESELTQVDTWGVGLWWHGGKPEGEIYKCPNHEQFETPEDAFLYWDNNVKDVHSDWEGFEDGWNEELWDTFGCESNCHYVSGSFYTDRNGELHEGYPC